jgi:hypothetical protein
VPASKAGRQWARRPPRRPFCISSEGAEQEYRSVKRKQQVDRRTLEYRRRETTQGCRFHSKEPGRITEGRLSGRARRVASGRPRGPSSLSSACRDSGITCVVLADSTVHLVDCSLRPAPVVGVHTACRRAYAGPFVSTFMSGPCAGNFPTILSVLSRALPPSMSDHIGTSSARFHGTCSFAVTGGGSATSRRRPACTFVSSVATGVWSCFRHQDGHYEGAGPIPLLQECE